MTNSVNLIDLVGYEFYLTSFTVVLCILPFFYLRYTLTLVGCYCLWKILCWVWRKIFETKIDVKGRGVFITGCDSGLGFAFARRLDEDGLVVFAGCLNGKGEGARKLKSDCSKRLHVVEIDVSQEKSVESALTYVRNNLPRQGLWAVINNAGVNMFGEVELTPVSLYERALNINLFGPICVIQRFLPLIRQTKGRVINITSVHGRMNLPGQSNYETAKHGLETMSDSLRLEMKKFGVTVCIVEPGMYGKCTSIQNESVIKRQTQEVEEMWERASPEVKKTYSKKYLMSWIPPAASGRWPPSDDDVYPVINAVEHAVLSGSPKSRYLVDGWGKLVPFIDEYAMHARVYNILPTWIVDKYTAAWRNCYRSVK